MDLILQLKQEHVEILRLAGVIFSEDLEGKDSENLAANLKILKETLVAHLDLEDKLLYPALENCEKPKANELGKKFSEEMKGISKVAFAFFDKYLKVESADLLKDENFKKEFQKLAEIVEKRVNIEEKFLYPAYEAGCDMPK